MKQSMKELKEPIVIDVKDLENGSVYMTHTKDLVQIKNIDAAKDELHLYNITESCNVFVKLAKHQLIRKIR